MPFPAYVPLFVFAALTCGYLFAKSWARRDEPYMGYLAALTGTVFAWTLLAALYHLMDSQFERHIVLHLRYVPISLAPVALLLFALAQSGDLRFFRIWHVGALLALPLATMALIATNDSHHLFFQHLELVQLHGRYQAHHVFGPWFWVHTGYSYLLFVASLVAFAVSAIRTRGRLRLRSLMMLVGAMTPGLAVLAYLSNEAAFSYIDPAPVAFAFTSLMFGLGVFRMQSMVVVPVSKHRILDSVDAAMFVLGSEDLVIEANRAAGELLGARPKDLAGRTLPEPLESIVTAVLADGEERGRIDLNEVRGAAATAARAARAPASADADTADQAADERGRWFHWHFETIAEEGLEQVTPCRLLVLYPIDDQKLKQDRILGALEMAEAAARRRGEALRTLVDEFDFRLRGIEGLSALLADGLRSEESGYARLVSESAAAMHDALREVGASVGMTVSDREAIPESEDAASIRKAAIPGENREASQSGNSTATGGSGTPSPSRAPKPRSGASGSEPPRMPSRGTARH